MNPDRLLYEYSVNRDPELRTQCQELIQSGKLPAKENIYHLVIRYFLIQTDLSNAFLYMDRSKDLIGFVRPRTLNMVADHFGESQDYDAMLALTQKPYFWETQMGEASHYQALSLLHKGDSDLFWKVFRKMMRDIQFVSHPDKLIPVMEMAGFTTKPVPHMIRGMCICGTSLQTVCYAPPDPKNFEGKIDDSSLTNILSGSMEEIIGMTKSPGTSDLSEQSTRSAQSELSKQSESESPKQSEQYTIIIDGANVGFYDLIQRQRGKSKEDQKKEANFLNWDNILNMDRTLKSAGHIPLFVFNKRHRRKNKTEISTFYSPFGVNDDPYFAYLSITMGVPLVSNDDLCDMVLEIDSNVSTWVAQNRLCYRFEKKRILFFYKDIHANLYQTEPISYSICMQGDDNGFHFPCLRNKRVEWICISKIAK